MEYFFVIGLQFTKIAKFMPSEILALWYVHSYISNFVNSILHFVQYISDT